MTKAEEKAMDAWAIYEYREHPKGLYHTCFVDGYKEGYEQAEKDLALTCEDVAYIVDTFYAVEGSVKEKCEEVLRRFNEYKKLV